jgi:thymidylate kinase
MFIILDSPDRCGKDSHIQAIKNHFNDKHFQVLHYGHTKQESNDKVIAYNKAMYSDMFDMMIEAHAKGRNLILNRSHLGEAVYSPKYRKYSGDYVFDIEQQYANYLPIWDNIMLIVLVGEPEKILKRDDGNSYYSSVEDIQEEIDAFKEAAIKSRIKNKIIIHTDYYTLPVSIDRVIEFIKNNK